MNIHTLLTEQTIDDQMSTEAVSGLGIYRGVTVQPAAPVTKQQIRTDRNPRNGTIGESILFNVAFEELFGHADVRKRAAFCATDGMIAASYGVAVVEVNPLKTATVAYNPNISDSIGVMDDAISEIYKLDYGSMFMDNLDECNYQLPAMQNFKSTVQAVVPPEVQQEFVAAVRAAIAKPLSGYVVKQAAQLQGEIQSGSGYGVEVMVFNSDYYYAVESDVEGDFYD